MTKKNTEPTILPVKPGSLSEQAIEKLEAIGITVIEHEEPSQIRLIRPSVDVEAGTLLKCAMQALMKAGGQNNYGSEQRREFAKLVTEAVMSHEWH